MSYNPLQTQAVTQTMTIKRTISRLDQMLRWRRPRRAMVSLWTLLMIPVLLVLFGVVIEGVHLWLARVELENALEAAALAAVKEWAESGSGPGPGWTAGGRIVGQTYAAANSINQTPVSIDTNLGTYSDTNPNENLSCEGNLVFGAVTEEEPLVYIFDANKIPSCGAIGNVMIDVTSQNPDQGDDAWGISFRTFDPVESPNANETIVITRVEIDLNPAEMTLFPLRFDPNSIPILSSNSGPKVGIGGTGPNQDDNFGFYDWPTGWPGPGQSTPQITFTVSADRTWLTIDFAPFVDGLANVLDAGFSPGDRFRFGIGLQKRSGQSQNFNSASGDDVAGVVQARVYFGQIVGDPLHPIPIPSAGAFSAGTFEPSLYRSQDCAFYAIYVDDLGNEHVIVHPIWVDPNQDPLKAVDLPCPETSASPQAQNNGQSFVHIAGGGALQDYGVRAQASHQVPSLLCNFLGIYFGGPFTVSACTTAMYDCALQRPRLIRVEPENFYCTVP